jgi:hypothetical protein
MFYWILNCSQKDELIHLLPRAQLDPADKACVTIWQGGNVFEITQEDSSEAKLSTSVTSNPLPMHINCNQST